MANEVDKNQISDSSIVEEAELSSTGLSGLPYSTGLVISIVDSITKKITLSSGDFNEPRTQELDHIVISGGSAVGNYTIDEVLSDTEATVKESIVNASSGTIEVFYRSGAEISGFDPTDSQFDVSVDTVKKALDNIKKGAIKGNNLTHFLVDDDLDLPANNTTLLASPSFDGCLNIDGEGYIL